MPKHSGKKHKLTELSSDDDSNNGKRKRRKSTRYDGDYLNPDDVVDGPDDSNTNKSDKRIDEDFSLDKNDQDKSDASAFSAYEKTKSNKSQGFNRVSPGDFERPSTLANGRPLNAYLDNRDQWDCVSLRVRQVPSKAHSYTSNKLNLFGDTTHRSPDNWKKVMGTGDKNAADYRKQIHPGSNKKDHARYHNIIDAHKEIIYEHIKENFGDSLMLEDAFETLVPSNVKDSNIIKFLENLRDNYVEEWEDEIKYTIEHLIKLLENSEKHAFKQKPEWLHSIADCLGGPVAFWNGASGTYAANTQMSVIEHAIMTQPGIGVQVETYTEPNTRIAEWYVYTVFATDKDGKPFDKITFHIDAKRDWYNDDDEAVDVARIKNFLATTKDKRPNSNTVDFSLPEVVSVHLRDDIKSPLYSQYNVKPGPIYAHPKGRNASTTLFSTTQKDAFRDVRDYQTYYSRANKYSTFPDLTTVKEHTSKSAHNNLAQYRLNYKVDKNYLYEDRDINIYCESIIRDELGGYAPGTTTNTFKHFLLNNKFNNCLVAVTAAIDTIGASTPIDYFLDKRKQPGHLVADILSKISINQLVDLKKLYADGKGRDVVQAYLMEALADFTTDKTTIKRITDEIASEGFDPEKLKSRCAALNEHNVKLDVFDELLPEFKKDSNTQAKIIFPYNITQNHWCTAEIIITKNNPHADHFTIDVYSHNPYGGGQMDAAQFERIQAAITERLGIDRSRLTFNKQISTFTARQNEKDGTSCGVITADDIIHRIKAEDLKGKHPKGAEELRNQQIARLHHLRKQGTVKNNLVSKIGGKVNTNYLYEDRDINIYCESIIHNELGGYSPGTTPKTFKHFLLNSKFKNNKTDCLVAVAAAIDTAGTSTPIDYFLNKDNQPGHLIADILEKITKEQLAELQIIYANGKGRDAVQAKLTELLAKHTSDKTTIARVTDEIATEEFSFDKVKSRCNLLNKHNVKIDIFDELIPELRKDSNTQAKIIFPYNITQTHWCTAEIIITKNNPRAGHVTIDVYSHDPYGGGQMDAKQFERIQTAITGRLGIDPLQLTFNNKISPFTARQDRSDGTSCGVITADDIIHRIKDEDLTGLQPQGAEALRTKQDKLINPTKSSTQIKSPNTTTNTSAVTPIILTDTSDNASSSTLTSQKSITTQSKRGVHGYHRHESVVRKDSWTKLAGPLKPIDTTPDDATMKQTVPLKPIDTTPDDVSMTQTITSPSPFRSR